MPSPIAHSLMGCLIARQHGLSYFDKPWKLAVFCAVLANLPDVDYFFGMTQGLPNLYHRHFTHSIGFSLLIGALCGLIFLWRGHRFWPMFVLSSVACASHVLLDFLGLDTSTPHGVIAFWPFSDVYFMSPVSVFSNLKKGQTVTDLLKSIFILHNISALAREIVVFTLLLALQNWFMKNRLALRTIFKSRMQNRQDALRAASIVAEESRQEKKAKSLQEY
jgi:membrane-bound metal-dependent hydrolase YbcI (DUF457 family)